MPDKSQSQSKSTSNIPKVKSNISKTKKSTQKKTSKNSTSQSNTKIKKASTKSDKDETTKTNQLVKTWSKSSTEKIKKTRPIIQVKDLVKKYEDFTAVNGVSFDVQKGEIFGILGPNGAGKTTTLEIIETLLKKTSGKVLVDGLDIDIYQSQVKNIIGVQLQDSGFYPKLNLVEILKMFGSIYRTKINPVELLEIVGLQEKSKSEVDKLSGGQKQRFSIATTLISDPEILFLDEPTTGLDPQARRKIWDLIQNLKKRGKTVVLTTHYMDEAETLCDRIAIIDSGQIVEINTAEGFVEELLSRGFTRPKRQLEATLEDVFLDLTGKNWRD